MPWLSLFVNKVSQVTCRRSKTVHPAESMRDLLPQCSCFDCCVLRDSI